MLVSSFAVKKTLELKPSAWFLIGANAIPFFGVLFFNWSAFEIVFLYWLENLMFGVINLMKMAACVPDPEAATKSESIANQSIGIPAKLFVMPFFTVHYGLFCFVHGVFVVVLLSEYGPFGSGGMEMFSPFEMIRNVVRDLTGNHLFWALLALAASHLYSYVSDFLGNGEHRKTNLEQLMNKPYGRIVVLHVALLFGAFLIVAIGSPIPLLLILIAGKTYLDLKMHLKEQRLGQANPETSGGIA